MLEESTLLLNVIPKEIPPSDDYLWKEANFYKMIPQLDSEDNIYRGPSVVEVEPRKYLYLNLPNHKNYNIGKEQEIARGGEFIEKNGKEYVIFKDKEPRYDIFEEDAEPRYDIFEEDAEPRYDIFEDSEPPESKIELVNGIRSFINSVSLKRHLVGEHNDINNIFADAMGQSNYKVINDWVKQRSPHLAQSMRIILPLWQDILSKEGSTIEQLRSRDKSDYTIYEQIAENLLSIFYDAPTILPLLLVPGTPATKGFVLGFVNTAIKLTFHEAVRRKTVNTFDEFKQIFVRHALGESLQAGVQLGATFGLAPMLGITSKLPELFAQLVGFEFFAFMFGEEITKEKLLVDFAVFTSLGVAARGVGFGKRKRPHRLFTKNIELHKKAMETGKTSSEIIDDINRDPTMREDLESRNIEAFRSYKDPNRTNDIIDDYYRENAKSFESYKKTEMKIEKIQKAEVERLRLLLKAEKTGRVEVLKTDKEKIAKLENEYDKLHKDPEYIPTEFTEAEFLLHSKEDIVDFNRRLRIEVADLLTDLKSTKVQKLEKTIKKPALNFRKLIDKVKKKWNKKQHMESQDYFAGKGKAEESLVAYGNEAHPIKIDTKRSWRENLMIDWFDKLYPFRKINESIIRGKQVIGEKIDKDILSGAEELQLSTRAGVIADSFIQNGQTNFLNYTSTGESLSGILKNIKTPEHVRRLDDYLLARRALEEYAKDPNTKVIITKQKAERIVRRYDLLYKETAQKLYNYQNNLLQYLYDSGFISSNGLKAMRELSKNYVPWYFPKESMANPKGGTRAIYNPLKEKIGKTDKIISPLESIYKNTFVFVEMAHRNNALRIFIDEVYDFRKKGNSKFIPEIKRVKKKILKKTRSPTRSCF